jgi:Uma2 family endonuclease
MPGLPEAAYFDVAPDWICEVLSPGTARFDRAVKLPLYAAAGVSFAWLIDPLAQTLEVYERNSRPGGARWLLLETYGGDEQIRPVPFDALPFQLGDLWAQ